MRTIYLFLLAFLPVLCWSCYDDKGNYDYHELNRTEVTGIKPVYRCDLLSRLSIPTVIQSEDKGRTYDYVWMTYQTTGDKKIDTLSQEKDLDWIVLIVHSFLRENNFFTILIFQRRIVFRICIVFG